MNYWNNKQTVLKGILTRCEIGQQTPNRSVSFAKSSPQTSNDVLELLGKCSE